MIQRSIRSGQMLSSLARLSSCALPLGAALLACSADVVTMGEDGVQVERPPLPGTSRCRESTTIQGDVLVRNRDQLAELEGCVAIEGSLTVVAFFGADLRPLHALSSVTGKIDIGGEAYSAPADYTIPQPVDWLESLAGLESLESAGSLEVKGLLAHDVDALSRLRTLTWPGTLSLEAQNLESLEGLRQLRGIRSLSLECYVLESLEPLVLPREMDSITLVRTPLTWLPPLNVEAANRLTISDTRLVNLDAFASLTGLTGQLDILHNQLLENVEAFNGIEALDSLTIGGNPLLRRLPDFTALTRLDSLGIYANDSLENIPTLPKLWYENNAAANEYYPGASATPLLYRPSDISILWNDSLPSITLPAGWASATRVAITNNAVLTRIEFTQQSSMDLLQLINNPSLEAVELGNLGTIDRIELTGSPSLDPSVFDSVRTFERTLW